MEAVRDYTIKNGLGVRVWSKSACRVIRLQKNEWVEIGQPYALPVDPQLLKWEDSGIPASILAVAVKIYELDHPGTNLRAILTSKTSFRRSRTVEPAFATL